MKKIIVFLFVLIIVQIFCTFRCFATTKYEDRDLYNLARKVAIRMGYDENKLPKDIHFTDDISDAWIAVTNFEGDKAISIKFSNNYFWTDPGVLITMLHEVVHVYTRTNEEWQAEMKRAFFENLFPEISSCIGPELKKHPIVRR